MNSRTQHCDRRKSSDKQKKLFHLPKFRSSKKNHQIYVIVFPFELGIAAAGRVVENTLYRGAAGQDYEPNHNNRMVAMI